MKLGLGGDVNVCGGLDGDQEPVNNTKLRLIEVKEKYKNTREKLVKCTFWRYYAINYLDIGDIVIFRDCDSRLSYKEKACVDHWISSEKTFHLIFDHILHQTEIMGGLWGVKGRFVENIKNLISSYFIKYDQYYCYHRKYDQYFLKDIIYHQYLKYDYIAHGNPEHCNYHFSKGTIITPAAMSF